MSTDFISGGTPSTLNPDYWNGKIPWMRSAWIKGRYVNSGEKYITEDGMNDSAANLVPKGSLLVATRVSLGNITINNIDMAISQDLTGVVIDKSTADKEFLYWALLQFSNITKGFGQGTAILGILREDLEHLKVALPPLSEQQKIASILSNVDSLIQQTQKIIEQTRRLRKGLMQGLLTKGIGHARFKTVNLGERFLNVEIPESWSLETFGNILTLRDNPIEIEDSRKYTRIIVKRRHESIVQRDVVYGRDILTKNQYKACAGEFIVSRRQIIHNACGIVPMEFDGVVVSNEYSLFSGSDKLDINYFDWFSQTNLFHKTIIVTTHGVTIEKYVFLLDEWMNLKMPLPSIEEQKRMAAILSAVENKLTVEDNYKHYLKSLKKGLMQKLLTGRIRVKA